MNLLIKVTIFLTFIPLLFLTALSSYASGFHNTVNLDSYSYDSSTGNFTANFSSFTCPPAAGNTISAVDLVCTDQSCYSTYNLTVSGTDPITISGTLVPSYLPLPSYGTSVHFALYGNTVSGTWWTPDFNITSGNIPTTNFPPKVTLPCSSSTTQGVAYTATGSFTDPDSSSWTATVDYGDGSVVQNLPLSGMNFSLNHIYNDPGTYSVIVLVTDNQGATGITNARVTVNPITPSVGSISVTSNPVIVNNSTTATATFTDQGVITAPHTATWNWGDGNITSGTVTEPNGTTPGSVSDNHTYTQTGVYTITLTVAANNGGAGTQTFQYVSVYSPTPQGLFSGARIFTSPAGAYPQNTSLTGKVMFGVSVKYSGTNPTGRVDMNFKNANLNFTATTINSLVTSNGMATVIGTGTINGGTQNYAFLATGLDSSQGGPDIRLQIKDPLNDNNIVYDSQLGEQDTATPTSPVTGNVVVH